MDYDIPNEAFKKLNRNDVDFIMNIQGDEPEIDITDIKKLHSNMKENKEGRIGTLATKIFDNQMYKNQNVVKVKIKESFDQNPFPLADNFFRKIEKKFRKKIKINFLFLFLKNQLHP